MFFVRRPRDGYEEVDAVVELLFLTESVSNKEIYSGIRVKRKNF